MYRPAVDEKFVREVDVIDVGEALNRVVDVVGVSGTAVAKWLAARPVEIALAMVDSMACLRDQGKLAIRFYQDRQFPQSVGVYLALDTAALLQFDSLRCAWEAFAGWMPMAADALPDPVPYEPALDPCFERKRVDSVEIVWIASTDWMCSTFEDREPTAVCADGSVVHARTKCENVQGSIGYVGDLQFEAQRLAAGFDARHRGMEWRIEATTVIDFCRQREPQMLLVGERPRPMCRTSAGRSRDVTVGQFVVYVRPDTQPLIDYVEEWGAQDLGFGP